jgi:rhamnosyltransferase
VPRVIAVVPTYRPDRDVLANVRQVARQVDDVVMVDDGSGADCSELLDAVEAEGAHVIRLGENAGIASALNAGARAALARGADFVLTVDQDTVLPDGYTATALGIFERANPVTRIGIVAVDAVNGAPALPTWTSPEGFGLVPEAS